MDFAWASAPASDPWLAAAYWSGLGAWGTTLLLVISISIVRAAAGIRGVLAQRREARWRPILAAVIAGEEAAAFTPGARELRAVLVLWNQHAVAIKGPARERLSAWAQRCRLGLRARHLLTNRSTADRLLALATLAHLGDRTNFQAAAEFAALRDPLISFEAARALIAMDSAEAFVVLREPLIARADWSAARLLVALREQPSERLATVIAGALREAHDADLPRLLHFAHAVPAEAIASQVREILARTEDRDALVGGLKLLADPRDAPLARRCLAHGDWVVRLAAVRALGRVAQRTDLPALCAALADTAWWVRQRAAQAIVALPYLDVGQLKRLQTIVADRYGADALARAIADRNFL